MKVLVIGAAGKAGHAAVSSLLMLGGMERIFLADHDAGALGKLSADLGHLPVSPRFLDAESERGLRERMAEADLVLGCLGPFHRYEGRIVEAAIASGRDYLSLCDDPAAAEEAFSLDAEAERRGVSVICGCGLTPGLSNLLACQASSRLDRVDAVDLAWFLEMGSSLGAATLEHLLHAFGGKVPSYGGGRERKARAGSWEELVEFPPPVGRQAVGFLGHPEPITLPRSIDGVLDVKVKGGVDGRGKALALQSLAWMGSGEKTDLWETALRGAAMAIARRGGERCMSALRVQAVGERRGVRERIIRGIVGDYYRISGLVLAAAVGRGREAGRPPGVHPPEMVLDHRMVFAWLRRNGVRFLVGEERPGRDTAGAGSTRA